MLRKPQITLLAVTSLDGFIAKQSGHIPATWASIEEQQHFFNRMDQMDFSVMGRVTHEAAYRPDRRRMVFSSSAQSPAQNPAQNKVPNKDHDPNKNHHKEWRQPNHLWVNPVHMNAEDVLACLDGASKVALLGGTRVHDWFLERNLIDVIELSVEPQIFGQGLALFDCSRWQGFVAMDQIEPAMAAIGFALDRPVRHLNDHGTLLMRFSRQK